MTYAQALVNEDAPLFQNPETQELLFTGTDFYGDSDIPMCAHGFWCEEHAVRTYGHDGATTSGQANMVFDLDSKIGLVVMVNEPNGNWYINYASDMAFGELSPEKYVSGTAEKTKLNGYYLNGSLDLPGNAEICSLSYRIFTGKFRGFRKNRKSICISSDMKVNFQTKQQLF